MSNKNFLILFALIFIIKVNKISSDKSTSVSESEGFGPFNASSSVSIANKNENEWMLSNKNVTEKLSELNIANIDDIEWKRDQQKIVPNSLNQVKTNFKKTTKFNKITTKIIEINKNIQEIINNAIRNGGEAVLPSGIIRLDRPISIYGARNLKIRGSGSTKLIFQTTRTKQNRYYDIQVAKSNGVTIQDIEIDMDPLPFTQGIF
jgi:hypothetical protein